MAAVDPFEFFLEKAWSDGFPVVTPTEERVQWMLAGTRCDPDEIIGHVPPALEAGDACARSRSTRSWPAASPSTCRWCSAACGIILREEFNMGGVQCTMHGVAPLMIVNGPYAQKIGLHGGNGCFGPGFRANATIGRAIRLHAAESRRRASPAWPPPRCSRRRYATRRASPRTWRAVPWESARGVARLCARGQRDHLRHGGEPAAALRRREHRAAAAAERHRGLDDRAGIVEHVVPLRHGGRDEPAAREPVRRRGHEPRRRARSACASSRCAGRAT